MFHVNIAISQAEYLTFPDIGDIHGALLTLSELAAAFGENPSDYTIAARHKVGGRTFQLRRDSTVSRCSCTSQTCRQSSWLPGATKLLPRLHAS